MSLRVFIALLLSLTITSQAAPVAPNPNALKVDPQPAVIPQTGYVPPPYPTTDVTIPLNSEKGLFISGFRIHPEKDDQGTFTGRVQAICMVYNYTPYALSSVTIRASLYGNGADGPNTLISSHECACWLLSMTPDGKTFVRVPPGFHNHAYGEMFKPTLLPGQDISGGYWITLLSARGLPYVAPAGMSPEDRLRLAVVEGDLVTATLLCKDNPTLARVGEDSRGLSLLWYAAISRHAALAECLLKYGAAVDGPVGTADPPIIAAAEWGSANVVDVLLTHHADLKRRNNWGMSALDAAQKRFNQDGAGEAEYHVLNAIKHTLAAQSTKLTTKTPHKRTPMAKS